MDKYNPFEYMPPSIKILNKEIKASPNSPIKSTTITFTKVFDDNKICTSSTSWLSYICFFIIVITIILFIMYYYKYKYKHQIDQKKVQNS